MGDPTKILIRRVLFGNVKTSNGDNVNIYPSHLVSVKNPIYPCITLSKKGETRMDQIADDELLFLSVWSKVGNDELWDIYLQVKKIINLKGINGDVDSDWRSILLMRQVYIKDDLYESDTFTHQLATRYKIDII